MAGLQDISPRVSKACVSSRVRAPKPADTAAASQPACPPPMTTTSNFMGALIRAHKSIHKPVCAQLADAADRNFARQPGQLHRIAAAAAAPDNGDIAQRRT